jgi:signal transduction histidine kinase
MLPPPLPPDEPRRLAALRALRILDTEPEERFERVVRTAVQLFGVPMALVSLVDANRQWFKCRIGISVPETPREFSFCAHAVAEGATLVIPDALADPRFCDNPYVTGPDGVRFYAGRPLRAADGSPVGTLCIADTRPRTPTPAELRSLEDLASWAELELNALTRAQVQALAEERIQVERLKSEFVATVSHELRTPLTSIRGALGLLAGGVAGELPPAAKQLVGIAHGNGERLARLVDDLLDLEKVESGRMAFELQPVELQALLASGRAQAEGHAGPRGVALELVQPARPVHVLGDADRLHQVLANLLSNAVKFSSAGQAVTVRLEAEGGEVRLSVEDRGPGVPPAFRERLFEKFAQADGSDARARGGTGLGLSISRALARGMGGSLEYAPREGGGSVFRLRLPAWLPPPEAARAPAAG